MVYSQEVQHMCVVKKGPNHGPAPIPEEGKWVKAKEIKDISGLTHGIGWCAPQQGACKLTLNIKEGVIEEALVETIGCSGMTHSAAMAAEILPGKTILEALNTDLVCDAINTAMRELFLQIVYGRSQSAFSEGGLVVGAGLEDLGKGLRSQVGTTFSTKAKGVRYLDLAEGYITRLALDEDGEVCGYGWTRLPEYDDRIKTVYEFETFFNQSAYLYPAMALYFRSLNVSSATMWTYTMQEYAPWHCGSHFLSMTCTPRKAASFMVAGEIFRHIPAGQEYSRSTNEQTGTNYAISRSRDLSIWSDSEQLIYSGDITQWTPVGISPAVKKIAGVGSSPLVKYDGTGLYFVEDKGDELRITVNPDHTWTGEPWNSLQTGEVSRLDYDAVHEMSISLDAWPEGSYILYRIDDSGRTAVSELSELRGITVSPGEYAVTRK